MPNRNKNTEQLPLKWVGGKAWLVQHLRPLWEQSGASRLVEPFVGGGAIAFNIKPTISYLSDLNPDLINFYQYLQQGLNITIEYRYDRDLFITYRNEFNKRIKEGLRNSNRSAQLFWYLNRTGFNGLCRYSEKTGYNVSFGKYKSINYQTDFSEYQNIISNWDVFCHDYKETPVIESDFLYVDPPYDESFTHYTNFGFSWDDQKELAHWAKSQKCNTVVVSNKATERILELYQNLGYEIVLLDAPRNISCNGDRTRIKEMLAVFKPGEY